MTRTLLLIDGEHYPPVIEAAVTGLAAEGRQVVGAVFLGGWEKTGAAPELPVPVWEGRAEALLAPLIDQLAVDEVLDTSDEPVLDHRRRRVLAGLTVAAGATYLAGGMRLDPVSRPRLTDRPTVSVAGTGKRTGKTAIAIALARHWRSRGLSPCIVTMGRGGPPEPLVLRADEADDPPRLFERLRGEGLHASSDYVEDAVFARVDTVGTRRLGAGPAGVTVADSFAGGVAAAEALDPDVLVLEGSGTAVPPAGADLTVLASRPEPEVLVGTIGIARAAIADVVVCFGDPGPLGAALGDAGLDPIVVSATLVPEPSVPVEGRRVVLATTAPPHAAGDLVGCLRELGAVQVRTVHSLSDRRRLSFDLHDLSDFDLVLTELKAAAADVVIPAAGARGVEVGLVHNAVQIDGGIEQIARLVEPTPRQAITR